MVSDFPDKGDGLRTFLREFRPPNSVRAKQSQLTRAHEEGIRRSLEGGAGMNACVSAGDSGEGSASGQETRYSWPRAWPVIDAADEEGAGTKPDDRAFGLA
jgi:hypothetical protein